MSIERNSSPGPDVIGVVEDGVEQVRFVRFPLDEAVVAPTIYRRRERTGPVGYEYVDQPNIVTAEGVVLEEQVTSELDRLLAGYGEFTGRPGITSRTDLLPVRGPQDGRVRLAVIEIGRSFPDGWGAALNLSRAAGIVVEPAPDFPERFVLRDEAYRPELELLVAELGGGRSIATGDEAPGEGAFVYGYTDPTLDDKRLLAEFARDWSGDWVIVPQFYSAEDTAWADIPPDVYLKFVDKQGPEAQRARFSVLRGKPEGKARFLRQCYEAGTLIVQREAEGIGMNGDPYIPAGEPCENPRAQVILLSQGAPITGYVQYSDKAIINDDSVRGPLQVNGR